MKEITSKPWMKIHWSQRRFERDDNGLLTPLAMALDAIADYGCHCGNDDLPTGKKCLCCLCENALRDQWEQLNGYRPKEAI